MSTRAEILNGADFEGYEDFCAEVVNSIKNHYRVSDPTVNMVARQPGEILSDPDDDKLYHVGGASGYPCDEILQATRSCDVIPEFKGVDFYDVCNGDYARIVGIDEPGLGHRLTIGLDETTRTMVICDLGDIDVDFGFTPIVYPTLYMVDDNATNYFRMYHTGGAAEFFTNNGVFIFESTAGTLGDSRYTFRSMDSTAMAAGVGGGVTFGGNYTAAGAVADFAAVWAEKENGISGQYGGELHMGTRVHGGLISSDIVINSAGNVGVAGLLARKFVVTINNIDGNETHLVATMWGGLIRRGTGNQLTANRTDISDTAANIVAAIPECIVGSGFEFSIANEDGTHTVALDGGAGVTMIPNDPSTAIPVLSTGRFLAVVTNATPAAEAVNIHALGYSTH